MLVHIKLWEPAELAQMPENTSVNVDFFPRVTSKRVLQNYSSFAQVNRQGLYV